MEDLAFLPAGQLAARLRRQPGGALDLVELYLARIEKFNPGLNAVIALDAERARAAARDADRALAKDEAVGPLHGVPVTLKESFNVTGLATSWGSPEYKDNIAESDALLVERL